MTIRLATAADAPAIAALWTQSPTNPTHDGWNADYVLARARRGERAVVNDVPPINGCCIYTPRSDFYVISEIMWSASLTNLQVTNWLQNRLLPWLKANRPAGVPITGTVSKQWIAFWQGRATADVGTADGEQFTVVDTG